MEQRFSKHRRSSFLSPLTKEVRKQGQNIPSLTAGKKIAENAHPTHTPCRPDNTYKIGTESSILHQFTRWVLHTNNSNMKVSSRVHPAWNCWGSFFQRDRNGFTFFAVHPRRRSRCRGHGRWAPGLPQARLPRPSLPCPGLRKLSSNTFTLESTIG